jgi:Do/DeqQ family serine protease
MRKAAFFASVLLATTLSTSSQAALPFFDSQGEQLPSLAPMLKTVNPAVVNIAVTATQKVNNPLLEDPFFRHFFNVPPGYQQERKSQAAGSGVVIDADEGTVLTNSHVVADADEITVVMHDGKSYKAKLIGKDPEVDIAVLKIDAKNLTEIKIADSDKMEVGDFVVAIGNPFGLGQTVTTGIVSALGRSGLGIEGYEDFIQTDASINPGNSGGALVNLKGELVGINTAILAPGGGNVGIGFAIPINMARVSLDQILEHGEVKRGQLGVYIQDLTPELAEAFKLKPQTQGVVIAKVQPGSAADKAGIKEGDVVVSVDGKPVTRGAQLRNRVGMQRIGESVKLTVLRDDDEKDIKVTITKSDESPARIAGKAATKKLQGAELKDSPDGEGVVVAAIEPGSPAAQSGLRRGDVIVAANRQRVHNVDELAKAAGKENDHLLLQILRAGAALYLVIR